MNYPFWNITVNTKRIHKKLRNKNQDDYKYLNYNKKMHKDLI